MARLPNTRFVVGDYAEFREPADIITAWFPFLTPASILGVAVVAVAPEVGEARPTNST
jgi:hypothetical protein